MDTNVHDLLRFIGNNPTAPHCVESSAELLRKAGFKPLSMKDAWHPAPGDRFYTVENGSTLAACIVGAKPPCETGFRITVTHTDSPCFRLKPEPHSYSEGFSTLGVEIYGGPIVATWFDRQLGLAGNVTLRGDKGLQNKLYRIDSPLFRFPTPAIHLNRSVNDEGFKANAEDQLLLIMGEGKQDKDHLIPLVAQAAHVDPDKVVDFSGEVFDLQPPTLSGYNEAFITSAKIDNQGSTHAAVTAMTQAQVTEGTAVICLFDSEEIGSRTPNGAASPFLERFLERLAGGSREHFFRACSASLCVSADGVHAIHPGWAKGHSKLSKPQLNKGPAIKTSARGSYASSTATSAYFMECARLAESPIQQFVARADRPSGGTLGPIAATATGIQVVDVGNPMLSMHSVSEMAGTADHTHLIRCLQVHLEGKIELP